MPGCPGFPDLAFDPWAFDRYDDFFDANSTFTLYPAGAYKGPASIQEYVKFASAESPYVEAMVVLPGTTGYLKGVDDWDGKSWPRLKNTIWGFDAFSLSLKYAG